MRGLLVMGVLVMGGCAAMPDPNAVEFAMPKELARQAVNIELISVNNLSIPQKGFDAALKTLKTYIAGPVSVFKGETVLLTVPADGFIADDQLANEIIPKRKLTGLGVITTVVLPKMNAFNRGFSTRLPDESNLIVLYDAPIRDMANWFVGVDRVYEIVFVHELGHALGVPHLKTHKWSGNHCTNGWCVMYPKPDWRSIISTIFTFGLPDDYCGLCSDEIAEERK